MVCKYDEVKEFFNTYKLIEGVSEEELKESFEIFSHACKFAKGFEVDRVECNSLDKVVEKTLELLDASFEHEYTKEEIHNVAEAICKVFDVMQAPKNHVPFILVMLVKL